MWSIPRLAGVLCTLVVAFSPCVADAQTLRFSGTAPGSIRATGNTLGLSKGLNQNGPGTEDSIGTFVSLGGTTDNVPFNPLNQWPFGTTWDWTANGSEAVLELPVEVLVLHAELIWGGSHTYAEEDVSSALDTPVTLAVGASSVTVTPDPSTALTISEIAATGFAANYYMRSADVTAFVKLAGSGTYAVSGVPATQTTSINSLNAAGWTLVVAYRDQGEPMRNLSIFVGGSFVDEDSQQDYVVSGFCSPPAGVFEGTVVSSTIEGDADLVGDQLLIAPTDLGPFVKLSGPNNPENNFFCSQLNDSTGQLDTQGTFGNDNHDAQNGINAVGGRQGWDVTTVAVSSQSGQLVTGQTSAVIRTITTGDSYVPTLVAFAIDVNAPDFAASGSALIASTDVVTIGDSFTVTAEIENQGQVTAEQLVFALPLDSGLALTSFETDGSPGDFDGNPVDAAALAAGADAGDLGAGETRQIVLELEVTGPPSGADFLVTGEWSYAFEVCAGDAPLPESISQYVLVDYEEPIATGSSGSGGAGGGGTGAGGVASGSGTGSGSGATGTAPAGTGAGGEPGGSTGGSGSGDPAEDGSPDASDDGGCGCSTPAAPARGWAALLGLLVLGAFARRRAR
jgi:MYXO-CTERM domain-containing protein